MRENYLFNLLAMDNLKLLIVEGNTKEENSNFTKAGCVSQSENFSAHIKMYEANCEIDIIEPYNDDYISKILSSIKDGAEIKFQFLPENEDPASLLEKESKEVKR